MGNTQRNSSMSRDALFDVSHVTAVVTGGATGIGLMIAQALVSNGAKVYITGRRQEKLDNAIRQYATGPGSIHSLKGDVTDNNDIFRMVKEVESQEPNGIQLLVNNAGIAQEDKTSFGKSSQPDMTDAKAISEHFLKSDPADWDATFRTNTTACFFAAMAFLPLLAKGHTRDYTSSIINISSISGSMKGTSAGIPAYACSKAATTHLGRMLVTTFKDTQVRVNTIAPGLFPSEMSAGPSDGHNKSEITRKVANPMGRPGRDEDMAASVLMLAGRGGLFYNHQILYPDGGSTLASPAVNN